MSWVLLFSCYVAIEMVGTPPLTYKTSQIMGLTSPVLITSVVFSWWYMMLYKLKMQDYRQ